MKLAHFILFLMLLMSCNTTADKWGHIKKTKTVYPFDSISHFKSSGILDTSDVWVNTAYKTYPYKGFCKSEVQAIINIDDTPGRKYFKQDSLEIAHMLLDSFRATGIAHFVAQTLNKGKLTIYLYTEEGLNPIGIVEGFRIPCNGRFVEDEQWRTYSELLKRP
ncbi:hypothetical protein ACTHGU_07665 [Chitinophagaceae bacterium MMS25-I14]